MSCRYEGDWKTTGVFSGDVDVNGQLEGMPWSQWSVVFRSFLGAFDPTATRLLRQVESNGVSEGFGFEAWKQLCREFEPQSGPPGADNLSMGELGECLWGTVR